MKPKMKPEVSPEVSPELTPEEKIDLRRAKAICVAVWGPVNRVIKGKSTNQIWWAAQGIAQETYLKAARAVRESDEAEQ